jgi:hypothetical protein
VPAQSETRFQNWLSAAVCVCGCPLPCVCTRAYACEGVDSFEVRMANKLRTLFTDKRCMLCSCLVDKLRMANKLYTFQRHACMRVWLH